jgi:hypothetical protein
MEDEEIKQKTLENVSAKLIKSVKEDFKKAKEKGYKIYLQNG